VAGAKKITNTECSGHRGNRSMTWRIARQQGPLTSGCTSAPVMSSVATRVPQATTYRVHLLRRHNGVCLQLTHSIPLIRRVQNYQHHPGGARVLCRHFVQAQLLTHHTGDCALAAASLRQSSTQLLSKPYSRTNERVRNQNGQSFAHKQ